MKKFTNLFTKIAITIIIIYSFIGFIILPYFIQFYIPTIIQKTIHTNSYVDSVHFNPFTFKIKISNLIIKDQKEKNLLFFETFIINLDPSKLLVKEIQIGDIIVDNLKLAIDINKAKIANFQYILDTLNTNNTQDTKTQKTKDGFLIKIDNLTLSNIRFIFEDYSKNSPFIVETKPITLSTNNIQLKQNHTNKINLNIDTHNTGKLSIQSNIIVEPLSLNGNIELSDIGVNKIFNYLKPLDLTFNIDSQPISISFDYQYTQINQTLQLDNLDIKLNKFLLTQDPFALQIQELQHTTKKALLQMGNTLVYDITDTNTTIQNIVFSNTENSSVLNFSAFVNSISNLSQDKTKTIHMIQTLNTPQRGTIQAKIEAIQEPLNLNITLNTKDIAIQPYEPYIKEFVNFDIKSGDISNLGKIKYSNENNQTNINLQSDLAIKNIDIFNSTNNQQLLKIDKVELSNIAYENNKLSIKDITLKKPYIAFFINDNNTTNFSNIIPSKPNEEKTQKPKNSTEEFIYTIDNISIKDGESLFEDNNISPKFVSKDTKINGDIKHLSSDKNKPTIITHTSIIDNYAPLLIDTNMIISNPTKALQTKIKVENIDLPSLSSYSGKFIGKTIENGKLSVTLDYDIKKAQLTSTNNIKIKDIKLGQTVQSKDAINAPIGLAIALLEDSDGYIDLDIPIDGDINSPNFHFSDVILDVITNTIVGIVSAPFKFLAMMIGLDGQDISNLEFDYGSYLISVAQQEKLDNIVKAFKKRPNLKLKINTTYVQNEDTIGLQERKFQEKYRQILTVKDNFDTIYKQTQTIFIKEFGKENFKELKGENKEKYQKMLKLLKNNIKITTEDLILLAKNRADNIKIYLVEKKLDQARILIDENIKTSTKDLKIDKALILFEIEAK